MRSRYRSEADAVPDYSHRFHAGNVGDVWKHLVLVDVLRRAAAASARVSYIDTHAGEGSYPLQPTGEWVEGIGRLWDGMPRGGGALGAYVELVRTLGAGEARPRHYPGSPVLARAVLPDAQLLLWERDAAAAARLRDALGDDERASVYDADGQAALADEVAGAEEHGKQVVVLVDPPWTRKADWIEVPDALARAVAVSRRACFVLWYPVKSLTRPNAMIARLAAAGVGASIAELITTALEHQRRRLNGSGVLLVRPPDGSLAAIAEAAPGVGERCAVRPGDWSFRVQSWAAG
jgi:23S rRNA (adenine2030-N6)-methyltransferase